ncbi:MAG: hypothetical protein WC781_02670 [Candidatus Pacearchaeota archaeon]|jgi:hypothetical protein
MNQKLNTIIASFLIFTILINFASAEIIWSIPTGVSFNIITASDLIINIISPTSKVYTTKTIPIEIDTNMDSQCSYSIDSGAAVSLGNGTYFKQNIVVANGNHNLKVYCKAGNIEKTANVTFTVNCKNKTTNHTTIYDDLSYGDNTTPIYGEWSCLANQMQRTVTTNNVQTIEYGGVCGVNIGASERTEKASWLWILPLILILLILILLVLITLVIVRK